MNIEKSELKRKVTKTLKDLRSTELQNYSSVEGEEIENNKKKKKKL